MKRKTEETRSEKLRRTYMPLQLQNHSDSGRVNGALQNETLVLIHVDGNFGGEFD